MTRTTKTRVGGRLATTAIVALTLALVSLTLAVPASALTYNSVALEGVTTANVVAPSCTVVTTASSLTFAHTVSGSSDRLLVVTVFQNSSSAQTVTYAGQSLTAAIAQTMPGSGTGFLELWYLVNPPSGTANVVVTLNAASQGLMAIAASFAYVDLDVVFSRQQSQVSTTSAISDLIQQGSPALSPADLALSFVVKQGGVGDAPPSLNQAGIIEQHAITRERFSSGPTCSFFAVATSRLQSDTVTVGWSAAVASNWAMLTWIIHPTVAPETPGGVGVTPPPPETIPEFLERTIVQPVVRVSAPLCNLWFVLFFLLFVAVALIIRHMKRSGDLPT